MTLMQFVERAAEVTGAYGNFRTPPERVDAETIATGHCQMVYQELELFIHFCYRQTDTGVYINLAHGSQIPTGVWTPWGGSGKSQLTRGERDIVRTWLLSLRRSRGARPLFFYVAEHRRWHVDTFRYPCLEDALKWLQNNQLTPHKWLEVKSFFNSPNM